MWEGLDRIGSDRPILRKSEEYSGFDRVVSKTYLRPTPGELEPHPINQQEDRKVMKSVSSEGKN